MAAPPELLDLIERFERNLEAYRSGQYKEAQLRQEFLNPFFKLLGWDVENTQGFAEDYKDVIHEDSIRVGSGGTEAPDYCFRIGGTRKFFVEAKKPSVCVKMEIAPAFQLRRYAWSAKLPLSILTDFEEFAVYDTRIRPDKADKASTARLFYCTFREYAEKWDWIAGIFGRESILKGSFDKFAHAAKGKRGTAEVDKAFLAEIEGWRDVLARHIASNNPSLSQRDLNFAVQRTIDRIIFLRICEDRGIEPYGQLQKLLEGGSVYEGLRHLFHLADDRYNSGIFHFNRERERAEEPDDLTPGLLIEDKPLKDLVRSLYYPDSPYEFSVFTADILGQIYEQFLGKVIRLTDGHRAVVEEKPEVKKAGGVYYTPTYIVDYIVQNTVGTLLEGKTPNEVSELKILDPACGSGSFLIGAYQYLLDWHRNWYVADGPEKWAKGRSPVLHQGNGRGPEWRLTTGEKRRILLNNIFGVDIDSQAVEVTKLSLLLKVLEGENAETLAKQLTLYRERALPDLGLNIKCGNSLIGPDFYAGKQTSLFDEEEQYRINAFDWKREFPKIMKGGGFDAVIGNPPYIRIQTMKEWAPIEVEHLKEAYQSARKGNYDIYVVFVEKGLALLNAEGRLGFILPHKFFNAKYGEGLRRVLSAGRHLSEIVHFGDQQIFAGATNYTCLLFLGRKAGQRFSVEKVADLKAWIESKESVKEKFKASEVSEAEWNFSVGNGKRVRQRLDRISVHLGDLAHIFVGTQTSADDVFVLQNCKRKGKFVYGYSESINGEAKVELDCTVPFLRGSEIRRYEPVAATDRLICPYEITESKCRFLSQQEMLSLFPEAFSYLQANRKALRSRERGKLKGKAWYAFGYPKSMTYFQKPKIIVPDYNNVPSFTFDSLGHFYKTGYGIILGEAKHSPLYILGLLNTRLLFQYLLAIGTTLRGGYVRFWTQYLEKLPIRPINFSDKKDKARHDRMVDLVERILNLHKKLPEAKTDHSRTLIQRQIEATDHEIDALVYDLYGLSEEEIKMVEEGEK
jgi:hypothetical protein